MPLIVSILQGWSHICKIGKCDFGKTLLTQCNSCARRFVLSAKSFFLFPISLYFSFCSSSLLRVAVSFAKVSRVKIV